MGTEPKWMVDGLIGLMMRTAERDTLGRAAWTSIAQRVPFARRCLFLRDMEMTMDTVAIATTLEWADGRSLQSMTDQISEMIRKAPRPSGVLNFKVGVWSGETNQSADRMSEWNEKTPDEINQLLAPYTALHRRMVRVLIFGDVMAQTALRYGWAYPARMS